MLGHPNRNEWSLLKDQFDALVHDEGVREPSVSCSDFCGLFAIGQSGQYRHFAPCPFRKF